MSIGIEEFIGRDIDFINIMGLPIGLLCWLPLPFFAVYLMKSDCEKKKELQRLLFLSALSFCSFVLGSTFSELGVFYCYRDNCSVSETILIFTGAIILYYGVPTILAFISLLLIWKKLVNQKVTGVLFGVFLFLHIAFFAIAWMSVTAGIYFLCVANLEKERAGKGKHTILPISLAGVGMLMICCVFCFFYDAEINYQKGLNMCYEKNDDNTTTISDKNGIKYLEKAVELDSDNKTYNTGYAFALLAFEEIEQEEFFNRLDEIAGW
ncbi:MAG: hypothetical protein KH828_01085 [Clostridiales bacterium]|nr:hypothetical protein [Clostridiales bacterium]